MKGILIRSRARWVEHGEKPSKYFCTLEKRNFVSKRMISLINKNDDELFDFDLINQEVYNFYRDLYKSKEDSIENVDLNEILKPDTPKLTDDQALNLEGHITLEEAGNVLRKMNNNRSPGSTGFTVEFYKFFWKDLGIFIVNSINYGFDKKEMSTTIFNFCDLD